MLSNKMNVLQLAALMRAHGIGDVVLCPGSRDVPLTQTFSHVPDFRCYSLTDERSAGFFALGLAQQHGTKVAVVVTSGSAVANLHPAVCEAYYQQVPLLIISADRPAAWIGQMDGQTMPQPNLFQSLVRKAVSLPQVHDDESLWHCNRLINEALLELDHGVRGPVQINVPISEPFFDFSVTELPEARVISRLDLAGLRAWLQAHEPELTRVLLVVGQNCGAQMQQWALSAQQSARLHRQMQVFSELPSNFALFDCAAHASSDAKAQGQGQKGQGKGYPDLDEQALNSYLGSAQVGQQLDWILTGIASSCEPEQLADWTPQVVISVGGHIVSKKLKQFLRKHPPKYHLRVDERGEVSDLFMHLTHVVEAPWPQALDCVLEVLDRSGAQAVQARQDYVTRFWKLYQSVFSFPLLWPLGAVEHYDARADECNVVHFIGELLGQQLPAGSTLHLGNSSALRFAEFAALRSRAEIKVQCNRGINGIEGSLSAAVGAAYLDYVQAQASGDLATCPLHYLVIGDLSFYYDCNGLWHSQLPPNLRIVMINNNGGEIFRLLPGLKLDDRAERFVRGVHHTPSLATMQPRLEALGIDYLEVGSMFEERDEKDYMRLVLSASPEKLSARARALKLLLAPFAPHSSLILVEYHCAPDDSNVFQAAIAVLLKKVKVYVEHRYSDDYDDDDDEDYDDEDYDDGDDGGDDEEDYDDDDDDEEDDDEDYDDDDDVK